VSLCGICLRCGCVGFCCGCCGGVCGGWLITGVDGIGGCVFVV